MSADPESHERFVTKSAIRRSFTFQNSNLPESYRRRHYLSNSRGVGSRHAPWLRGLGQNSRFSAVETGFGNCQLRGKGR
jgi:hypothetical protein